MGIWLYQCAEVSDPLLQNQSPHFPWTPREFISPEFFLNFFLNLYSPPWSHKSFKVPRLLQIHLWVKKLNLFIFNHAPKQNSPQIFIITLQADGNCPFLPRIPPRNCPFQHLLKIFFPEENGGRGLWSWKNYQN